MRTDPPARPWLRPALLAGALLLCAGAARLAGFNPGVDDLRAFIGQAGPLAPLAFIGLMAGANVAQIPAWLFVAASPLLFPPWLAWLSSWAGVVAASCLPLLIFRRLGGQPLAQAQAPWLRRLLAGVDRAPVRTVAILRGLFMAAPQLNLALALTGVGMGAHALGTAVGVLVPVTFFVFAGGLFTG